jgi:glycosyltransferase involved in cell wall biosynthesis
MTTNQNRFTVLYTSHFPTLTMGGQKSMHGIIAHLDRTKFRPLAIVPQEGDLSRALRQIDCPVTIIPLATVHRAFLYRPLGAEARQLWRNCSAIRAFIRDERIDIVHTDEESDAVTCGLARFFTSAAVLYHIRLTNPCRLDPFIARLAGAFAGVSEATKNRFKKYPAALKNYRTLLDGVDCTLFKPSSKKQLRRKLGLPADTFIALFVGQIKKGKGIFDIIDAMKLLLPRLSTKNMPLLIMIGRPIQEGFLDQVRLTIKDKGLSGHARLFDQQSNIHEWMQAADVLVLPSHEGVEGLPRVIFEAQACGCVPIGSDTSGVREAIENDGGLLVPQKSPEKISDALENCIKNKDLLNQLSEKALSWARTRFDMNVHARKIEQLYLDMITRRTRSSP